MWPTSATLDSQSINSQLEGQAIKNIHRKRKLWLNPVFLLQCSSLSSEPWWLSFVLMWNLWDHHRPLQVSTLGQGQSSQLCAQDWFSVTETNHLRITVANIWLFSLFFFYLLLLCSIIIYANIPILQYHNCLLLMTASFTNTAFFKVVILQFNFVAMKILTC